MRPLAIVFALITLTLLGGCSSTPPKPERSTSLEFSIQEATPDWDFALMRDPRFDKDAPILVLQRVESSSPDMLSTVIHKTIPCVRNELKEFEELCRKSSPAILIIGLHDGAVRGYPYSISIEGILR